MRCQLLLLQYKVLWGTSNLIEYLFNITLDDYMIVRSKSPLRLGLAGGGSDVSPYSDIYGGCVLNATIDMYAYCTIETIESNSVEFIAKDLDVTYSAETCSRFDLSGDLILHKAVYNRVVEDFNDGQSLNVKVITYSDAPPGSGLGSSSTMVVSILHAYQRLLNLPLGEYDLAHLAYKIERIDCGFSGGKQDQYATAFGGFNFMEFYESDRVIVNPLRIRESIVNELEANILLYYTGVSRESAKIIEDQIKTASGSDNKPLDAMHEVKKIAVTMKEKLLRSDISSVASIFKQSWEAKKQTSKSITNPLIDDIYTAAMAAGAKSFKVSGAGGGGFIMIFVEPTARLDVMQALSDFQGGFYRFQFTERGTQVWTV